MKLFLTITAIFEAITGLALVAVPNSVAVLLLRIPIFGAAGIFVAMIAGAAITILAFFCWLSRKNLNAIEIVQTLLVYNIAVPAIAVYGVINYQFEGVGIWLVAGFHLALAIWCVLILQKKQPLPVKQTLAKPVKK